jgi:ElaB/YqjD/DUF883 family membrane-anchored ribosome-binding protein
MSTLSPTKNTTNKAVNRMEDSAEDISHTLREVAKDTGNTVREFLSEKSEQAQVLKHQAEERIVNHPMQSVALAALGGLVLGALLRR